MFFQHPAVYFRRFLRGVNLRDQIMDVQPPHGDQLQQRNAVIPMRPMPRIGLVIWARKCVCAVHFNAGQMHIVIEINFGWPPCTTKQSNTPHFCHAAQTLIQRTAFACHFDHGSNSLAVRRRLHFFLIVLISRIECKIRPQLQRHVSARFTVVHGNDWDSSGNTQKLHTQLPKKAKTDNHCALTELHFGLSDGGQRKCSDEDKRRIQ